MRLFLSTLVLFLALIITAVAQTPMDVQPVKELKPTGTLGTSIYSPVSQEMPFFKKLSEKERATGSFMASYTIHGKVGKYVSWFGIVRGIAVSDQVKGQVTLLMDQKYFDGMTDSHIMLVSYSGSGDFRATLQVDPALIPALSLVRVYGRVTEEKDKVPHVEVEYIRVWPWLTFTFTDLGASDEGNPLWAKYSKFPAGGRIYNPYPKEDYYLRMLGDPKFFGVNWKSEPQTSTPTQ